MAQLATDDEAVPDTFKLELRGFIAKQVVIALAASQRSIEAKYRLFDTVVRLGPWKPTQIAAMAMKKNPNAKSAW